MANSNNAATKGSTAKASYKKRLEGINVNSNTALYDLWKDAHSTHVLGAKGDTTTTTTNNNNNNNKDATATAESSLETAAPQTEPEAIEILRKTGDPSKLRKKSKSGGSNVVVVPIRVLQSIRILSPAPEQLESLHRALLSQWQVESTSESTSEGQAQSQSQAQPPLAFTPPPSEPKLTPERKKYLTRMEKLRLKVEETKYTRITTNIKDQRQEDDTTTKSMTYAASVGINMIVAPISFGVFIYFFSGGVFDYLFPSSEDDDTFNRNPTGVDIKRVILAVISGVAMMIIEMLLFVIRSHEFETHTTKKKKKRGVQPFGSYSANSAMTYTDDSRKSTTSGTTTGTTTATTTTGEQDSLKKNK
mmetsp:Transcript_18700/g.40696  ORF Transcript_18700/g.40696 Transcript_18700/m.40696 type:complete len:361 (-) Transcript_18700:130-1212(-)